MPLKSLPNLITRVAITMAEVESDPGIEKSAKRFRNSMMPAAWATRACQLIFLKLNCFCAAQKKLADPWIASNYT